MNAYTCDITSELFELFHYYGLELFKTFRLDVVLFSGIRMTLCDQTFSVSSFSVCLKFTQHRK